MTRRIIKETVDTENAIGLGILEVADLRC